MTLKASRPLPTVYPQALNTIGDHIRKKRLDLGLLQKEVAQQLGVDSNSVTNWEKGRTSPRLQLMPRIIEFLEYTPFQVKTGSLGERIVALRRVLGIRQEDLAGQLGVDPSTLARWEQGKGQPSDRHQVKLTEFLDMEWGAT